MATTGQKAGTGAVLVGVLALITALITLTDNHWRGGFGNDTPTHEARVVDRTESAPEPSDPAPAADSDIFLNRDAVPADGSLKVSGENFAPREKVVISIGTIEVARTTANRQGGFSNVVVEVPAFYANFQKPMQVTVFAVSKPTIAHQAERPLTLT